MFSSACYSLGLYTLASMLFEVVPITQAIKTCHGQVARLARWCSFRVERPSQRLVGVAMTLLSPHQVEYKRGHDERVSRFTTVADPPELLRAKAGGQLQSDVRNDEGHTSLILV